LIGIPSLRINGDYLAIATLGFGEIFNLGLINGGDLTRGPRGLPGIPPPALFGLDFSNKATFYYLILILFIITYIVAQNIPKTFFGRALMAIRDDEDAAVFMGINISKYKVIAFALSGLFAGMAGAFYAHYISYISPDTFVYNDSVTILTMVLLGGSGTVIGPVVGAACLIILPEMLRSLVEYRMLVYGLIVVLMMQIRPNGILGHINLRTKYIEKMVKDTALTEREERDYDC
jgi:branched-chain amino acid transport system permease protein